MQIFSVYRSSLKTNTVFTEYWFISIHYSGRLTNIDNLLSSVSNNPLIDIIISYCRDVMKPRTDSSITIIVKLPHSIFVDYSMIRYVYVALVFHVLQITLEEVCRWLNGCYAILKHFCNCRNSSLLSLWIPIDGRFYKDIMIVDSIGHSKVRVRKKEFYLVIFLDLLGGRP